MERQDYQPITNPREAMVQQYSNAESSEVSTFFTYLTLR